ncbi:MAG: hypothetical protein J7551_05440 [Chloroflexi bacterium]|jgi:hypothetical protein|nr:hypothetical protein [Chloroflexota bacterium]
MSSLRAQYKVQLKEAYALIKAERRAEAYELIAPILAQQPDYVDAWWLAAHSAPTLRAAMLACQKVLALKPDHAPAKLMLEELSRRATIEERARMLEQPRRPKLQSAKPSKALQKVLLVAALAALPIAIFLGAVVFTGETFGLPIGQLFSFEQDLPALPLIAADESGGLGRPSPTIRAGTLPVGAKHSYRFNAPRANIILQLEVHFLLFRTDKIPREAVRLRLPSGFVQPPRDSAGAPNSISFFLPYPGIYTLELIGTPKTKSFYVMGLFLFDLSID